ncbi:MAG: DNA-3-methyladenine glycosylase I, partial [Thermoplasmata archaeon]|nr:DNA-3-methyladenine glycosylase I [Thermoplasmata archaeon]
MKPQEWPDGRRRCFWANPKNPRYIEYHDTEWGVPTHDDARLFEMLLLECFQAGLSWECVLNKRDAIREAFEGFDPVRVAAYTEEDVERIAAHPGVIRNRPKIRAAVRNAGIFLSIQEEFGTFADYMWGFTDGEVLHEVGMTTNEASDRLSEDLKKRGMRFVGSVTMYAYMQSAGLIWSHEPDCFLSQKPDVQRVDAHRRRVGLQL